MKKIHIIHNPTAGDAGQDKKDLLEKLERNGRELSYVSTDEEDWQNFSLDEDDILVLAGGDGTVHKVVTELLSRKKKERKIPIYLVPSGTANNIATTLNIETPRKFQLEENFRNFQLFDYGKVSGIANKEFFLEGIGFGVFPELIRTMKELGEVKGETAEEKLDRTLQICSDLVTHFKPPKIKIEADGEMIKGKFLLVEVLNTKHIGPNLKLAPKANPGDGLMDLILIPPQKRDLLLKYIQQRLKKNEKQLDVRKFVQVRKVKKAKMQSKTQLLHVDDEVFSTEKKHKVKIKVKKGEFRFF